MHMVGSSSCGAIQEVRHDIWCGLYLHPPVFVIRIVEQMNRLELPGMQVYAQGEKQFVFTALGL